MTMDQPTPGSTPPLDVRQTPDAQVPFAATGRAKKRRMPATTLLVVGAFVAIGGVSLALGRVTAPATATTAGDPGAGRGTGTGEGGGFGGGAGGTGGLGSANITGTVVSVSDSSIQLKLSTGDTVTLTLGNSVTYRDSTAGSASEIAPGATVELGLAGVGGGTNPTASGNPQPSGSGAGSSGNTSVQTITVVKP